MGRHHGPGSRFARNRYAGPTPPDRHPHRQMWRSPNERRYATHRCHCTPSGRLRHAAWAPPSHLLGHGLPTVPHGPTEGLPAHRARARGVAEGQVLKYCPKWHTNGCRFTARRALQRHADGVAVGAFHRLALCRLTPLLDKRAGEKCSPSSGGSEVAGYANQTSIAGPTPSGRWEFLRQSAICSANSKHRSESARTPPASPPR